MRALIGKMASWWVDGTMCNMMHAVQWRRRKEASTREALENYMAECSPMSREEFYRMEVPRHSSLKNGWIEWDSPRPSGHSENDRSRVLFFPARDQNAPVVFLLHALMSASDVGYRRLAAWFNKNGWSAAFPHLPYHYSRTPRGYWNGELAITSDLVRNAEAIRQGVIELRQLMSLLRTRGTREFGIIGTSYGGWNGALLSLLEKDFRFVALVQPIINTEKAVWENPGSALMRRELRAKGHLPGDTKAVQHLVSAVEGSPLCDPANVIVTAGLYDRVSPIEDLELLTKKWRGSKLLRVPQGHFGYSALRETMRQVESYIVG